MDKAKAAGIQIIQVSDADKKPFQDAVKPVWDKYGPKYADMVKRIQDSEVTTVRGATPARHARAGVTPHVSAIGLSERAADDGRLLPQGDGRALFRLRRRSPASRWC